MTDNAGAVVAALAGDTGATGGDGAAAPTPAAWYAGSNLPPETVGYLESKGWHGADGLPKLIDNYKKVEAGFRSKTEGMVAFPKDENDTAGYDALYNKLGRPESADKYTFPDGVDTEAVKQLAPELHKLGLSQKQVDALSKIDIQRMATAQENARLATVADQDRALSELKNEWPGGKFNENLELARRAMRGMGMTLDKDFVPLAQAIGAKRAMNLLYLAGINTREQQGTAAIGDTAAGFGMTPNRARAEIKSQRGQDLFAKARTGDKAAIAEWKRLQRAASPDGADA